MIHWVLKSLDDGCYAPPPLSIVDMIDIPFSTHRVDNICSTLHLRCRTKVKGSNCLDSDSDSFIWT